MIGNKLFVTYVENGEAGVLKHNTGHKNRGMFYWYKN